MKSELALVRARLRMPRAAAVAGIVSSVLLIPTLGLLRLSMPSDPREMDAWVETSSEWVPFAPAFVPVAGVAFLWFIGALRDRLGPRESRLFAMVSLGRGLFFLGMLFFPATALIVLLPAVASADERAALTMDDAVSFALAHHPVVRRAVALEDAASAQVDAARAGYLPSLALSLELTYGTASVLLGPVFGLPNIPNVSGPPTGRGWSTGAGSIVGMGLAWNVGALPRQMALVDVALAGGMRSRAAIAASRVDVGFAAADAFVALAAQRESVRTARSSVERARVFVTQVEALVAPALRPGADLSRARAELALASTELARAEERETVARATFAAALGAPGQRLEIDPGPLLDSFPADPVPNAAARHPRLREADADSEAAHAGVRAARLEYVPRIELVGSLWGRGTGFQSGPVAASAADGLLPDTPNWVAGAVVTWPALEAFAVRARARAAEAGARAADAGIDLAEQAIATELDTARAVLEGAESVARQTPMAVLSARDSEAQARARYGGGLASAFEVADAERTLTQAEADDALAHLGVWTGRLLVARALGDLDPFLVELRGGGAP